jgi:sugar lactone lactonase YvrE
LVQTVVPDSGANVYALSNTQMVETNSGSKTVKLTITGLTSANAITTDVSGNIYINHSPNGQDTVVKYSPTGTLLKTIPYNTIPGEWYGNAIAVSPNGATIWVEDSHNGNALYRFDGSTGAPTIIRDGNIGTASGLATDSSGNLFVMSTQAWSIAKLNSAGVYQTKVTQSAGGFGVSPSSITVDGQNNVLMSVSGSNGSPGSISKFSNSLAYLDSNTALPSTWIIPGASAPIGTVVSDANSNLFISLMNNYQISGISNGAVVSTVSMNDLRAFTVR